MAHADRSDPLVARRDSFGPLQGQRAGDGALQLDMFGGPALEGMRTELKEILGAGAAAPEPPGDDTAQLRLEFLKAELARVDAT